MRPPPPRRLDHRQMSPPAFGLGSRETADCASPHGARRAVDSWPIQAPSRGAWPADVPDLQPNGGPDGAPLALAPRGALPPSVARPAPKPLGVVSGDSAGACPLRRPMGPAGLRVPSAKFRRALRGAPSSRCAVVGPGLLIGRAWGGCARCGSAAPCGSRGSRWVASGTSSVTVGHARGHPFGVAQPRVT